jgi:chemotaxis-related protein WspD
MDAAPDTDPVMDQPGIDMCWSRIGVRGDSSCPKLREHVHCRNCPIFGAAALSLLDRAPSSDYLADWTRHFAQAAERSSAPTQAGAARSVVIFRVGVEWLALPTSMFAEIAEPRVIHSLPHRRGGALLGIVNVRGELLICLSLAKLLGHEEGPAARRESGTTARRRLLVVGNDGSRIVFPVDEVHGVHRVGTDDLSETPATIAKAPTTYTIGMLAWQGRIIGCLDGALLLAGLDRILA